MRGRLTLSESKYQVLLLVCFSWGQKSQAPASQRAGPDLDWVQAGYVSSGVEQVRIYGLVIFAGRESADRETLYLLYNIKVAEMVLSQSGCDYMLRTDRPNSRSAPASLAAEDSRPHRQQGCNSNWTSRPLHLKSEQRWSLGRHGSGTECT